MDANHVFDIGPHLAPGGQLGILFEQVFVYALVFRSFLADVSLVTVDKVGRLFLLGGSSHWFSGDIFWGGKTTDIISSFSLNEYALILFPWVHSLCPP